MEEGADAEVVDAVDDWDPACIACVADAGGNNAVQKTLRS